MMRILCRFLGEFMAQSGSLDHAPPPAVWGCVLSDKADDTISMCCTMLNEAGSPHEGQRLRSFGIKVTVVASVLVGFYLD